jgi:hypothetical protein
MPNVLLSLLDGLFIKRRMIAQSTQALERLREVLNRS